MPPTRWPLICVILSGSYWREKKVKTDHISKYITQWGDLRGYSEAFKGLWAMAAMEKVNLTKATTEEVAHLILLMHAHSHSTAQKAYAACLLLPHLTSLRFCAILKRCKQEWNTSVPRYTNFWNAGQVLQKNGQ